MVSSYPIILKSVSHTRAMMSLEKSSVNSSKHGIMVIRVTLVLLLIILATSFSSSAVSSCNLIIFGRIYKPVTLKYLFCMHEFISEYENYVAAVIIRVYSSDNVLHLLHPIEYSLVFL